MNSGTEENDCKSVYDVLINKEETILLMPLDQCKEHLLDMGYKLN